jgi:hypothetical protein
LEYDEDFKLDVISYVIEGIVELYGYDPAEAERAVKLANLEWSIDVAPDMIAHCSLEQLIDMVLF